MNLASYRLHASVTWRLREHTLDISSSIIGAKLRIQVPQPENTKKLLSLMAGFGDVAEVEAILAAEANQDLLSILEALESRGMLLPRKLIDQRYESPSDDLSDRQARFFNSFENESSSGASYLKTLRSKKVAVFGLGGFGSWLVLLCDRIGMGTIVGVDFDHVELSNLPRQVLFGRRHLGMKKVDACQEAVLEAGMGTVFTGIDCQVETVEQARDILKTCDLAFIPFGHTPLRKIHNHVSGYIAKACVDLGIPYLFVGANMVGPLWIPRQNIPCYFCLLGALDQMDGIDPAGRSPLVAKRAFAPPIAASCSRAVWDAAGYLTGAYIPHSLGRVLGTNWLRSSETFLVDAPSGVHGCDVCGRNAP